MQIEFNIDNKHYCDREQSTKLGGGFTYGTACYYRSIDWKKDTVDDTVDDTVMIHLWVK